MKTRPDDIETQPVPGEPILKEAKTEPCVVVIFGATGDLTRRKLVPALYNLFLDGLLPTSVAILGVGRTALSNDEFRKRLHEGVAAFSRTQPVEPSSWRRFTELLYYCDVAFDDTPAYPRLKEQLGSLDRQRGTLGNHIYYLATPPQFFPVILKNLRASGLTHPNADARPWSRVVIEKPLGRDLRSAEELNALTAESLAESQTFRIDHYLGKETVQNIMVFRFGNSLFEPLWNRKYVDHVEITAAESIGIEGRGSFYEQMGVLRDVVQNHLLQVLCLCAMEPPVSFAADDVRDQKTQVLRSLRPITGDDVPRQVIRAQYRGYRDEPAVVADSRTATYVAMRILVDNWRWQGVPFYLRAGKRLKQRLTEVEVHFQQIPLCLFNVADACQLVAPNTLTMRIQPQEGISLRFVAKVPGEHLSVGNVSMNMDYSRAFGKPISEAYERLLLDSIRGDPSLFSRRDWVEWAWRFVTPIQEAWDRDRSSPLPSYEPESQGPKEANQLLARDGRAWRQLG